MANPKKRSGKTRVKRSVPAGIAFILATFNNTKVSFTDPQGNVIAWANAGVVGFKGSRKSTPFAARQTAEDAAKKAMDQGMRAVDVHVKGPGSGRESAIRAIQSVGMTINVIRDITPIPHNGCRPPKRRRV
ncbi:MAG: 30S ribosomal protein S11 [Deltaproteobacteria bacterium]|nr:30S ribosomal protein S11 [Deltaproteobacteria bacterium]